jgi:hypothetical protein
MRRFVMEHTDFSRAQGVVTKHVNVMSALSERVAARRLMDVSSVRTSTGLVVGRDSNLAGLNPFCNGGAPAARCASSVALCFEPCRCVRCGRMRALCFTGSEPTRRPSPQIEQDLANPAATLSAAASYDTLADLLRGQVSRVPAYQASC